MKDDALILPSKRSTLGAFFLLTFALTWGLWVAAALARQGRLALPLPPDLLELIGAWAPGLFALLLTGLTAGRAGLGVLLRRIVAWRVGLRWYAFALLWPPALSLATTGIALLLGAAAPDFAHPPAVDVYPAPAGAFQAGFLFVLPVAFVIQLLGSSLGEELGWRGFAQPRLQSTRSPLAASVMLGLVWGIWHIPRLWVPAQGFDLPGFGWLLIGITLDAVLYGWLFNSARGSLLPVLLLHTSTAITNLFLAAAPNPAVKTALTALVVAWVVYGARRGTSQPSPVINHP